MAETSQTPKVPEEMLGEPIEIDLPITARDIADNVRDRLDMTHVRPANPFGDGDEMVGSSNAVGSYNGSAIPRVDTDMEQLPDTSGYYVAQIVSTGDPVDNAEHLSRGIIAWYNQRVERTRLCEKNWIVNKVAEAFAFKIQVVENAAAEAIVGITDLEEKERDIDDVAKDEARDADFVLTEDGEIEITFQVKCDARMKKNKADYNVSVETEGRRAFMEISK